MWTGAPPRPNAARCAEKWDSGAGRNAHRLVLGVELALGGERRPDREDEPEQPERSGGEAAPREKPARPGGERVLAQLLGEPGQMRRDTSASAGVLRLEHLL